MLIDMWLIDITKCNEMCNCQVYTARLDNAGDRMRERERERGVCSIKS